MNHQPFEAWLLSESTLSPQEARALREHLSVCASCRQLSLGWREVEFRLRFSNLVEPAPGFTNRWQSRLATDRLRSNRRQTMLVLFGSLGGSMVLMAMLGLLFVPLTRSPLPFLLVGLYQLMALFITAGTTVEIVITSLRAIIGLLPGTTWLAILVAIAGLLVIWIAALRKLTSPWRIST